MHNRAAIANKFLQGNVLVSNRKVYPLLWNWPASQCIQRNVFFMANQVHSYITRNSNTFCIISCPNKYTGKTFWYKTSWSKMFQFNYKVLLLDLFLNLHVHVHWKHFSLADSPVLQWCFSAPVVARLITWREFFFLNGHLEMLLELLNFFRTKKFS